MLFLSAGLYSTLQVDFQLQRHMGYFLIQIYVPCTLIVIISWVNFWINREATADRVSLGTKKSLSQTELKILFMKTPWKNSTEIYLLCYFILRWKFPMLKSDSTFKKNYLKLTGREVFFIRSQKIKHCHKKLKRKTYNIKFHWQFCIAIDKSSVWMEPYTMDLIYFYSNSGITTFLTLTTLALDSRGELPSVPYPTALDWFIIMCYSFVVASMLEYAGVHYFTKIGWVNSQWEFVRGEIAHYKLCS